MVDLDAIEAALGAVREVATASAAVAAKEWKKRPAAQQARAEQVARDDRQFAVESLLGDEAALRALAAAPVGRLESVLAELAEVRGAGRLVASIRSSIRARAAKGAGSGSLNLARLRLAVWALDALSCPGCALLTATLWRTAARIVSTRMGRPGQWSRLALSL